MKMQMTLEEMRKKYPNQWLGLSNVTKDSHGGLIEADVVFTDKTASELAIMSINKSNIQPYFTTPDNTFVVGAVM